MTYPLPSYAASVWTRGDTLNLGFPPLESHEKGHSVKLEFNLAVLKNLLGDKDANLDTDERRTLKALYIMLSALKERESATLSQLQIGNPSAPIQYSLDQMMRAFSGSITRVGPKKQANEHLTLEDLGL